MPPLLAVVPAAGRSERFGSLKLVADVAGEPLLDRTLGSLIAAGIARVIVVLAPGAALGEVRLLADRRVRTATNVDPSRGMFSSIQAGLEIEPGDPIVVLPADMPFVLPATISMLMGECLRADTAVVPFHAGRRGHPVILPGRLRDALRSADPIVSLKAALLNAGVQPIEIPVDDAGVLRDVDTREDLVR